MAKLTKKEPCFKLKFTNPYRETFWFVDQGAEWPHRPGFFLIGKTTKKQSHARCFDLAEEALGQLKRCGDPIGWELVVDEKS